MQESYRVTAVELADPDRKRRYNRDLFSVVAPKYDVVTRVLSFGNDGRWKRRLLGMLPTQITGLVVDVACGTGDIAEAIAERHERSRVLATDLNSEMVARAKRRLHRFGERVQAVEADMTRLPLKEQSVDVLTGGYALRNAPDLQDALREAARVLKPGGKAAFLDFSRVPGRFGFAWRYRLLRFWGQVWGRVLHGDPEVYAYIARSLATFPPRDRFHELAALQGLRLKRSRLFFFGIMELSLFVKEP
ncbi:MAG: ubiquinone/menaquinone biosynthesis methyltransferase [Spirochaetaceae bacterium]